jgi:hypothetical protein
LNIYILRSGREMRANHTPVTPPMECLILKTTNLSDSRSPYLRVIQGRCNHTGMSAILHGSTLCCCDGLGPVSHPSGDGLGGVALLLGVGEGGEWITWGFENTVYCSLSSSPPSFLPNFAITNLAALCPASKTSQLCAFI